jgi:Fe-S cluster biogenesis protein NfuA
MEMEDSKGKYAQIVNRVEEALDQIRPYLEADGGNVVLKELTKDLVVRLELVGACKSCSMSMMTLKAGIEETVKRAVPEIRGVEAINLAVTPTT